MNTIRVWIWRQLGRWYHFALKVERAAGRHWYPSWGYSAWHRYAVYWPLVWSFKVWPADMRKKP